MITFTPMEADGGRLEQHQVLADDGDGQPLALGWVAAREYPWAEQPRWVAHVYSSHPEHAPGFLVQIEGGRVATYPNIATATVSLVKTAGMSHSLAGGVRYPEVARHE